MSKLVVCKTCGNDDLKEVSEGILKCKYCRHLTERPKENADLMERAHNLRFNSKDFDEAAKIYEEVIRLTPNEAEAYWGRVLCRFGIEYVKDTNGEYLPTCHRTIQSSILDDADYLMAVNKAGGDMKSYYTEQAKLIDTYQTKIKVIAAKEQPYDVFISFKATDNGKPTEDSLIAQEIYYYLTKNLGLKVFFSNITLKDKAGQEYLTMYLISKAAVWILDLLEPLQCMGEQSNLTALPVPEAEYMFPVVIWNKVLSLCLVEALLTILPRKAAALCCLQVTIITPT